MNNAQEEQKPDIEWLEKYHFGSSEARLSHFLEHAVRPYINDDYELRRQYAAEIGGYLMHKEEHLPWYRKLQGAAITLVCRTTQDEYDESVCRSR